MDFLIVLLFLLLPIFSVDLLFLKDNVGRRKLIINILLITNAAIYLFPSTASYFSTPEGESMFNENTGGGAFLWFYMILLPLCGLVFLILSILKIVFAINSKKQN